MRGADEQTGALFSYLSPEAMVPKDHPLRAIRPLVNAALARLSPDFAWLYALTGRASIAPEKLLRALLLQAFYSVRSERQLMEQLTYNMLFRWFVGLSMDAPVWDVTVFTKNRERLLEGDIARAFLRAILVAPAVKQLLSTEHFSVDGTLIEAWASMKSFRPKDGGGEAPEPGRNGARNFRGERRSNETHAGTAEREAAEAMVGGVPGCGRITLGADKAFDVAEHVAKLREMNVTPHVAQNTTNRASAIDGRTTRHPGYALSQRIRKRIEEAFGWIKVSGGLRKTRHRGLERVGWSFTFTAAAYNLIRLPKLLAT